MPADPKLGRAAALRNAMLAYMNDKESLLNAYPAFWAQSCRRRRPRVAVDPIFATIEEYKWTDNDVCDLWRQLDDDYGYYNYEEFISLDKARVSYHRQRSQAADRQRHHELLGSPVLRRGLYPAWGHGRSGGLRAPMARARIANRRTQTLRGTSGRSQGVPGRAQTGRVEENPNSSTFTISWIASWAAPCVYAMSDNVGWVSVG
jgi:hypothetical protein